MCVGGYNLSAGSRNNKKKPSLPNFLCYTAKRAVLCKTRYEDIDNQNSAPQCLGNLAINDLLFLSVREARLLKIIAGSSNDPPLGNRSERERESERESEQYSPFTTRWSTIRSSEDRSPPARAIQLFFATANVPGRGRNPQPTRRARND